LWVYASRITGAWYEQDNQLKVLVGAKVLVDKQDIHLEGACCCEGPHVGTSKSKGAWDN